MGRRRGCARPRRFKNVTDMGTLQFSFCHLAIRAPRRSAHFFWWRELALAEGERRSPPSLAPPPPSPPPPSPSPPPAPPPAIPPVVGIECFADVQPSKFCYSAAAEPKTITTSNSLQAVVTACLADANCACILEIDGADPRYEAKKGPIFNVDGSAIQTSWTRDKEVSGCDTL